MSFTGSKPDVKDFRSPECSELKKQPQTVKPSTYVHLSQPYLRSGHMKLGSQYHFSQ